MTSHAYISKTKFVVITRIRRVFLISISYNSIFPFPQANSLRVSFNISLSHTLHNPPRYVLTSHSRFAQNLTNAHQIHCYSPDFKLYHLCGRLSHSLLTGFLASIPAYQLYSFLECRCITWRDSTQVEVMRT